MNQPLDNVLRYKGYSASFTYDAEAGLYRGELLGTKTLITFEAAELHQVPTAFRAAMDQWLSDCSAHCHPHDPTVRDDS
nr:hypothetical protein [Pirellula staleyi]